jgi:preprotein translocase YajC subunit
MQITQIIFLAVIVGSFYFLLIRPQQQAAKKQTALVASL